MKHVQKMMLIPEHLLQSLETEHRLTSPPQLTTLTRLDQDMKHITDSTLPADQKVTLLDQLLQRYQGLSKQMKSETKTKPAGTATTTPNAPTANHSPTISEVQPKKTAHRKLPTTPVGPSKIPVRIETPPSPIEQETDPWIFETPPDSTEKRVIKRSYRARTPMVARLRSNTKWEPY